MTPEHRNTFAAAFDQWFKGNGLAVRLCLDLLEVAHLWDDLIDDDIPVIDVDRVMRKAVLEIPANPFYQQNMLTLLPVLQSAYLQWTAANAMEVQCLPEDRPKAYMLRASLYQVFHTVAALCGGVEWAADIGPSIYRLYGETTDDFKEGGNDA